MRLTPEEDALISKAASQAGRPVAEWMRERLLAAAKRAR
jgi:uncharacterized protein (DUF1778 family)